MRSMAKVKNPPAEVTGKRLKKLFTKWKDLLGEKERAQEGYIVIKGKEGDVGKQVEAFYDLFNALAYGDRSQYEKNQDEFYSVVDILKLFFESIKMKAEKKIFEFEERSAQKGRLGRINDWFFKILMEKPGSPKWYKRLGDTAEKTIVEIDTAVSFINKKFVRKDGE